MDPVLTSTEFDQLRAARNSGESRVECSLDLGRSSCTVEVRPEVWSTQHGRYTYLEKYRDRTIYYWTGSDFEAAARYSAALIKLVPTHWGPPTFEIDGIKMLPSSLVSPYEDARRKVALIQPAGKIILDTCGGLGYFAAWCVKGEARQIISFEKNADVLWLRSLNPWSPAAGATIALTHADVTEHIGTLGNGSVDAVLHDPPRFGIAGELYSQEFYASLSRVLKRGGRLFHYTGLPNSRNNGRNVPQEVTHRLQLAGFRVEHHGDGLLAVRLGARHY